MASARSTSPSSRASGPRRSGSGGTCAADPRARHGGNGMRMIINDYAHGRYMPSILHWSLRISSSALVILGTLVIFTFDPCPTGVDPSILPILRRPLRITNGRARVRCRHRGRRRRRHARRDRELAARAAPPSSPSSTPPARTRAPRRAAWRRRSATSRRTLGVAHLRHRQGRRLPGRPGRRRDPAARRSTRCIDLEHMGLPFNRTPDGKIDQRRFGGHTRNHGEAPVRRACYAADRTGHMILQTLFQQCIKQRASTSSTSSTCST